MDKDLSDARERISLKQTRCAAKDHLKAARSFCGPSQSIPTENEINKTNKPINT